MGLTVYKIDWSPPARAVIMTLEALNITDAELVDVSLLDGKHMSEEYLKMNPQHTVPVIKDGDFVLWDSHAICAYLVDKYGKDDSLYPKDLQKRAVVDQRLHFDTGILFPSVRGAAEPVLFDWEPTFNPEKLKVIQSGYDFLEKFLDHSYLAGDHLTIADICAGATVSSMNVIVPIAANRYPKISAWLDRLNSIEYFSRINGNGIKIITALFESKLNKSKK
ncbi:unnamed protein product [Plutella xylostella]|nr:glutathione S-transferase [Plutella xylostella]CAG9131073.1 unnamed protein product [Plutella xylostella]